MIKRIQLALEVHRAGPQHPELNSAAATLCPGLSPRQSQSIQPNERQEEAALPAWQAAALELSTHRRSSQSFSRTPQRSKTTWHLALFWERLLLCSAPHWIAQPHFLQRCCLLLGVLDLRQGVQEQAPSVVTKLQALYPEFTLGLLP